MLKGIVLAGGTGSRLEELTRVTNKHLLPVGRFPMIYYPVFQMRSCGIKEVLVVTGREHMGDVMNLLGSGSEFGLEFTYKVQDRAGGIAQALGLARGFVGGDRMMVILGDNIFTDDLAPFAREFEKSAAGAMILLKEIANPERFGVACFDPPGTTGRLTGIDEKPTSPPSSLAVTGAYYYDNRVFEITADLEPSARGEMEISDVNNAYIKAGTMEYRILSGFWSDAGTLESLSAATGYLLSGKAGPVPGLGTESKHP
jgi:glucose-1-phosphate thymidylyltransferase